MKFFLETKCHKVEKSLAGRRLFRKKGAMMSREEFLELLEDLRLEQQEQA